MINPAEIPQIPGDMEALGEHARALQSSGRSFAATGAQVHSTWQGLAPHYDAPEVGELLDATKPVSQISDTVGGHMETVGTALATYAETVKPIKAKLASLKAQAQTFVADVEGDDDWREDEDKVNEHNKLLTDVNDAVAEWMEAQRTCANAINETYGGTQYVADNGDGHRAGNEFGYSADQLDSAMGSEEGLPWGSPEEHDGGLLGDVGDFFVGIKDGAVQMVTDLGALIGYSNGEWSWGTAGQAWKGLGTFALALGAYSNPLTIAADQTFNDGKLGNTLLEAGKSIIAYDQWGKGHNGRAAGMATFNIVSAVVGTKGAGGALRGAGAGLKGAEASAAAARAGSVMVRTGDFIAKMPTVSELGMKVATKLDMNIPKINLGLAGDGPSFGHHVDTHTPTTRGPDVAPTTHHADGNGPSTSGNGPSIGDGLRHGADTDGTGDHADDGTHMREETRHPYDEATPETANHHGPDAASRHESPALSEQGTDTNGASHPSAPPSELRAPALDAEAIRSERASFEEEYQRVLDEKGLDKAEHDHLRKIPTNWLTENQLREVIDVRDAIKAGPDTTMSKVLKPEIANYYLDNDVTQFGGNFRPDTVSGFVARGVDVADVRTPKEFREALALDDGGAGWSPVKRDADTAYVMRFKVPKETELAPAYGGWNDGVADRVGELGHIDEPFTNGYPYLGNGYTGGGVPEYNAPFVKLEDRAEIWEVDKMGHERLVGAFDPKVGWFRL